MDTKTLLLPIERPFKQAVAIYVRRLLVILGIALLNWFLFGLAILFTHINVKLDPPVLQITVTEVSIIILLTFITGLVVGLIVDSLIREIYFKTYHNKIRLPANNSIYTDSIEILQGMELISHAEVDAEMRRVLQLL